MDSNNVEHAEIVERADHVSNAEAVALAGTLEVTKETPRLRSLRLVRDVFAGIIVATCLLIMVIVIWDNHSNERAFTSETRANRTQILELREQLKDASDRLDKITADATAKASCARSFDDNADLANSNLTIGIASLVVAITTGAPGSPERAAAVQEKIRELDGATTVAKAAIGAKIDYTKAGSPLPCPIS